MNQAQSDFLGTGWGFPPAFSKGGEDVLMVSREEDIMQSLLILLGTSLHERAMREDYGCNLRDYLFEELDARLLNQLRDAISNSIRLHEPRINLEDIHFDVQADYTQSLINIGIQFLVRSTNSRYNMVYPFYLAEGISGVALPPPATTRSLAYPYNSRVIASTVTDEHTTPITYPPIENDHLATFLHRPTAESTADWSRNYSILDHPLLNGKPEAIFFVTSLWGIGNVGAPTQDALEVGYLPTEARWAIYSKNDAVRMRASDGTPYFLQVLIAREPLVEQKHAFVHEAIAGNIWNNMTLLDADLLSQGNPNAYLLVTPRRGLQSHHEISVNYQVQFSNRWAIANAVTDGNAASMPENAMPIGAEFNVLVLPGNQLSNIKAFSHQTSGENTMERGTWMDHEIVNSKPYIPLFFTQAWRPEYPVSSGAHCPYHCCLWFDSPEDNYHHYKNNHWFIWAPTAGVPHGAVFNLFAIVQ